MPRKIKSRKPFRQNRIRKAMRRKALRRNMAIVAKREISRAAETKSLRTSAVRVLRYSPDNVAFDANIIGTRDFLSPITQGVGQGQRIGNRIQLKKMIFNCVMWPRQISDTPAGPLPWDLCMWIVSDKFDPMNSTVADIRGCMGTTVTSNGWFQDGNQSRGVNLSIQDSLLRINEDRFTVHKKKIFKIGVANTTNIHNNDYKISRRIKINLAKYMPKFQVFNDATGQFTTRQVWVVFLPVVANNDILSLLPTTSCANLSFDMQVEYKDV